MKIRRHKPHTVPSLNMTSMPDLIFTVLFFFMIVTHMRSETPKVQYQVPQGKELTKAANRRTVTNLYIGTDNSGQTRIQIAQHVVPLESLSAVVKKLRERLNDEELETYTINIRADEHTPMGIISDVKQELRKAGALNIRYCGTEQDKKTK